MTEVKNNLKVLFIILHIVIATCSTKHWNQIHIRFGHWTQALKSVAQIMQGKDKKCINNSKALSIFYFSILSCNVTLLFAEQSSEVTGLRSLYMHTIIMKHVKWYFKFFRVEIYIVQIEFSKQFMYTRNWIPPKLLPWLNNASKMKMKLIIKSCTFHKTVETTYFLQR